MVVKKSLRTFQTLFPQMADFKYRAQYNFRQLRHRPFEMDFTFLAHFKPDPKADFIDVGANRGQTVQAIRMYNGINRIHCFEPSLRTFHKLEGYVHDEAGVFLHNIGLSDRVGQVTLYTPSYGGYIFDGLASILREEAVNWLNPDRLYLFDPGKLQILEETVRLSTLDAQALRPAFVKIDVQGTELRVLKGGRTTISTYKPIILIETPQEDAEIDFLREFGYQPYSLREGRLHSDRGDCLNTFLIPPERAGDIALDLVV